MTRESLPAGYAITYLPNRAILWTPDCREIKISIDAAYQIMVLSIDGDDSKVAQLCRYLERTHA